jgi:hypothetical protein
MDRNVWLVTLLGSLHTRFVAMDSLADELGLPWQLLQRLLEQHIAQCESHSVDTEEEDELKKKLPPKMAWLFDSRKTTAQLSAALQQLRKCHAAAAAAAASECSLPAAKQAQLGPLPLWQQCVLEVALNSSHALRAGSLHPATEAGELYSLMTAGMRVADGAAATGFSAVTPLQQLLSDWACVIGPTETPRSYHLPWGRVVAQAAVELRQPQLLAWALQPEQRERLWGSGSAAAALDVLQLHSERCSPIHGDVSRHPRQQQQDLQQLRQRKQQLQPGRPAFTQQMAEVAMLLLCKASSDNPLLLSSWLERGLQLKSSEADVARAKAVLAAVAAAKEVPAGAAGVRKQALMRVLDTGDVDLLALFMCWVSRVA